MIHVCIVSLSFFVVFVFLICDECKHVFYHKKTVLYFGDLLLRLVHQQWFYDEFRARGGVSRNLPHRFQLYHGDRGHLLCSCAAKEISQGRSAQRMDGK
jgi:hypothetical protein